MLPKENFDTLTRYRMRFPKSTPITYYTGNMINIIYGNKYLKLRPREGLVFAGP